MTTYFQCWVSAENRGQADTIMNSLLEKKLVAGALLLQGPSRFWWKGKIVDMEYWNISAFTTEKQKNAIIDDVKKTSVEEVPMIWFVSFDGNQELLHWIDENVK